MKKLIFLLALFALIASIVVLNIPVFAKEKDPKVRICHATDSHTNPYTNPEVDQDSVDGDSGNDNGQGDHYLEHNGPVWHEGIDDHSWGDIIPPIDGVHAGKNWTDEGQAFWNNQCNKPQPSPTPSPSPEVSPSPNPSESPSPTASPSASPSPSPTVEPTPTPTPTPTPQPTNSPTPTPSVEQQMQQVMEEVKKENGGVVPQMGYK